MRPDQPRPNSDHSVPPRREVFITHAEAIPHRYSFPLMPRQWRGRAGDWSVGNGHVLGKDALRTGGRGTEALANTQEEGSAP